MACKYKLDHLVLVLFLISLISVFLCCAPEDPADAALEVAKNWSSSNVNGISKNIAGMVAGSNPLIEAAVSASIGQQINQKISWEYSVPQKLAEERYRVIATAYSEIELPLLGKYRISVNYNLEINTGQKQVISANIDPGSFAMRQN